ncbi:malate:quinone oxidoreductase, partial [Staphylococcus warneri]|uniref:malate:quinone oxidoreductase n=1 Tax=Staphylococcus warneri TaxID=1292 RepID=UPI00164299A0
QERFHHLPLFLPNPKHQHSQLITPPQPVQLIKHTKHPKANLQFPTQLITSEHATLPPLLPPSPPPSTALHIMF